MCNVTRKDGPSEGDLNINVQIDRSALDSMDKGHFWDYTSDNGWGYIEEDHRANGGIP